MYKRKKENRNFEIQFIVVISRQLEKQNKQYKFDKQQKTKKRPYHINKGINCQ